ncbi:5-(carboxyamino)imidazole ribonucleotide synthase [Govanella unica]|uniref:5-(carboxyamino)imidazole ribonucleotide synthase n=1 Tax=Govanella unica TaxID=2975056 RepID=UPI0023A79BB7
MITTAPGKIIGIMGGGQLGRMLAQAAAELGYRCHIYAPAGDNPAFAVAAEATVADYSDGEALAAFAAKVDVVTYEFENIPVEAVELLAAIRPVFPDARALGVTQDRMAEKDFITAAGGRTAPYAAVDTVRDAEAAMAKFGLPLVLKTRRFGYDGKGQVIVREAAALGDAVAKLGTTGLIAEGFVSFERELSVVLARGQDGAIAAYPLVENRHVDHILDETIAPAEASPELLQKAEAVARAIIAELKYVGVLAVEMFVTGDGIIVNELAPRVHNSGHWTMDACAVGQFEQHIRAICGLPLGDPRPHSRAVMKNLLGDDIGRWAEFLGEPGLCFHNYGKAEPRPGRKMGHVTRLTPFGI